MLVERRMYYENVLQSEHKMLVFAITLLPDTYRCTIDESPDIRIEYGIGALSASPAKVIVAIIFFRWLNDASFRHRSMCFPCKKSFPNRAQHGMCFKFENMFSVSDPLAPTKAHLFHSFFQSARCPS